MAAPALAPGVPFLGAGLDGRVEEGSAEARRDAEHPKKEAPLPGREGRRSKESAAEQPRPPEGRKARPPLVLQKSPDDASDAEGRDEHPERIARPLLTESVFLHDRLLEHAPRSGQAGQHLYRRPCRQDGPRSCFLHSLHHLKE